MSGSDDCCEWPEPHRMRDSISSFDALYATSKPVADLALRVDSIHEDAVSHRGQTSKAESVGRWRPLRSLCDLVAMSMASETSLAGVEMRLGRRGMEPENPFPRLGRQEVGWEGKPRWRTIGWDLGLCGRPLWAATMGPSMRLGCTGQRGHGPHGHWATLIATAWPFWWR